MPSPAYIREKTQQCEAVLAVLAEAGCPGAIPDGRTAIDALVLLRPALQALQVPWRKRAWIELEVRDNPQSYPWFLEWHPGRQLWFLCVKLSPFLMLAGYQGRHPVCISHVRWHLEVIDATVKHGWYDPATGHTPPPEKALDALEWRERGRDVFNDFAPGMGDAMTGHVPSTEEGRRNIYYRAVDDDGQETWINGMDLPTEQEEDDDL